MQRPLVGLFSEPNCLAVSLVENLLANFCRVEIVSRDKKTWQKKLEHVQSRGLVNIAAPKGIGKNFFDYALFLNFPPGVAIDYSQQNQTKTLAILPYKERETVDRKYQVPDTVGIIFVGDLFGPRMDLDKDDALSKYILAVLNKKRVPFSQDKLQDKDLHPVFIGDAAKQITKWLFSFGPFGKETTLLSGPTNFDKVLKETIYWFSSHPPVLGIKAKPKRAKFKLALIIGALVLALSPYLFLVFSGAVLVFTKEGYKNRNLATTRNLLTMAEVSASVALLGKSYLPGLFLAQVLRDTSRVGYRFVSLTEKAFGLAGKTVGETPYDPISASTEIGIEIDSVYQDILFLEGEIKTTKSFWTNYDFGDIKRYLPDIKKYLAQAGTLATELADVLGAQKKKVYLILLQNNMELRPTGGFIGSFALVSLDSGRISEIAVQDVYSADGQLKGHIEPPLAIKKYLKEANWYLRDSNWDPDFPTSAARAEWFLDKEIDVSVDGVVAIDLEMVKDLLKVTGPIVLPDFGIELEADNFYEKTQVEVEKDFFPGSYRKSGFLTGLTKALLERLTDSLGKSSLPLFEVIFDNLEKRHLQIFLHNPKVQRAVANLNWDGAVNLATCSNNCWLDWFGLIEANLGVNKANYYLERNFSLDVVLNEKGEVEKSLAVTYKNSANQAMGPETIYKVFSRLLIPPDSLVKRVLLTSGSTTEDTPYETEFISARQEVGSYFEVSPGQTRTLFIQWTGKPNLDLSRPGEYRLFWRKQAGTGDSPVLINFFNFPAEALTNGLTGGYNGVFSRDIVSRILWTNKF